jgi:hypothetical protein
MGARKNYFPLTKIFYDGLNPRAGGTGLAVATNEK